MAVFNNESRVGVAVNEWDDSIADYYTGRCSRCGQWHRHYPDYPNENDSVNRVFEDGFFDCHECPT